MIERLMPPSVVSVEAFNDNAFETAFPGEQDLIADAVAKRRSEFITARRCAREALARLGYPPTPIRSGPRREPQWPHGVLGSITHCVGYRAAAVARTDDLDGVGIDAEPHEPLPLGVVAEVASPAELSSLAWLAAAHPEVHWDRLLFCAKEAIYKAWYPLTRRWLGFKDARLTINPMSGTFCGQLLVDGTRADGRRPLTELHGDYLVEQNLILTATTLQRLSGS